MKDETPCELNAQLMKKMDTSTERLSIGNYVLLLLTLGMVFTMVFNASLIIINSGISLNIDFDLFYTNLIIAVTILLFFLKSYRTCRSESSNPESL